MTNNIIAWAILVLASLCLMHFIYEAIILPSLRLRLRFRLFALRDLARRLHISHSIDDHVFGLLDNGINGVLDRLHRINLEMFLVTTRAISEDPSLIKRAEKNQRAIRLCKNPAAQQIADECQQIVMCAFRANSGALIVHLMPLDLLARIAGFLGIFVGKFLKIRTVTAWVVNASEYDRNRIVPQSPALS